MSVPSPLGERARLVVTTLSDWHVGAGHGVPGDLNAVIRRDADGLPYLPGTSLTGVLREACRVVATALDDGAEVGRWQSWFRELFGSRPDQVGQGQKWSLVPARVGIGPARLTPAFRSELARDEELRRDLTIRRPGVAIDPDTGRASDGALRFVEVARAGLPLVAEVVLDPLPDDEDQRLALTALLVLGAAWCEQVGGDRRRGLGRVELRLDNQDPAGWAAWLADSGWQPPAPPDRTPAPVASSLLAANPLADADSWTSIDLEITTRTPVRVLRRVTGNVVRGEDFLPGSLLLAWLSQRWGQEIIGQAVWDQAIVVRHALPEVAGERGLPAPLIMHRSRDNAKELYLTVSPPSSAHQVRGTYTLAHLRDGKAPLYAPTLHLGSHNSVDPDSQRPTADAGVYEIEAIPPGVRLRSSVLLSQSLVERLKSAHGTEFHDLLVGSARFGARRRGEYGLTDVVVTRVIEVQPVLTSSTECSLWMVSDALVRGRGLRLSADPRDAVEALQRQLGVRVELEEAITRTSRRDSWQSRWQLPRESLIGLSAGSVLRVVFPDGPPDPDAWNRLLTVGLGERTAEGYGELVADPPLLDSATAMADDLDPEPIRFTGENPGRLDEVERAELDLLRDAATAQRIARTLPECRESAEYAALRAAMRELSRSQRGTWRAAAVSAVLAGSVDRLVQHAEAESRSKLERRSAQRRFAELVVVLAGARRPGELRAWEQVLGEHDCPVGTDAARATGLAELISDVFDGLRRDSAGEGNGDGDQLGA